ncbi:MAG: alpha/beta fold hydrolase [Phycisphaerae bacterium]|jgi:pimeloyl-ACP methyl ester carboxylesterase
MAKTSEQRPGCLVFEDNPLSLARPLPVGQMPECKPFELGDGYGTGVYFYRPATSAVARVPVVYLHGIQSHPGWFCASCAALAAAGHPVFAFVRRGSGHSRRRDRGHAASAEQLLEDLEVACKFALAQSGASGGVALLGVSWGGKLAACYTLWPRRTIELASLTLVAPGIVPQVDVPWATKAAIGLSLLLWPRKRFDVPLSDVELFTDNPAMRDYLRRDPVRLHRATARFLYASRELDRMLAVDARPATCCMRNGGLAQSGGPAISVPTTLILAAHDRIINNDATRQVVDRLTAGRAVVKTLDGSHTLEFEPDPSPLFGAIVDATGQ